MATTPEGKIKKKLDKRLKAFGSKAFFYSPKPGPFGINGIPDRVGVARGLFIGIECKANAEKKPTAIQLAVGKRITEAGGAFFLVYDTETIDYVINFINLLLEDNPC